MNKKTEKRNYKYIIGGVLFVVLFTFLLVLMAPGPEHPVANLTSGWDVEMPGRSLQGVELSQVRLGPVREGDEVILHNVLPAEEVPAAALQIKAGHATLQVYLNDTLYYEDGAQYRAAHQMTPWRFHHIKLPVPYAGMDLKIRLIANEDDAFTGMEPILVGSIHDLYVQYLLTGRLTVVAGAFLLVMGSLLILVFFYLKRYYGLEPRLLSSALISFLLGLYMLSYYKLTGLLTDNYMALDFVEYVSLFFLPFSFAVFLASTQDVGKGRLYFALAAINYIIAAALLLLYALGIIILNRFVPVIHILIIAEGLIMILTSAARVFMRRRSTDTKKAWKISEKIWVAGFFIMLLAAMIDVTRYALTHYTGSGGKAYANLNILTVGALVFVGTLILNFFYYHVEKVYATDMMNQLSGLAYTDPLTDMANRGKCEQTLQEVEKSGEQFIIISLDVDNLKFINDRFGHAVGDQYLAEMATVMNEAFQEADLVGRMGGDEFLAMIRGAETKKCEAMLREMQDVLAGLNREKAPMRYSISYGYATSMETAYGTVEAVYRLADSRMYAMKQEHHKWGAAYA